MKKILFNDKLGLTRAVLEGKKTMTRRVVKYPWFFNHKTVKGIHICNNSDGSFFGVAMHDEHGDEIFGGSLDPKYDFGEIIAVAQPYRDFNDGSDPRIAISLPGWSNKMLVNPELMPHHIEITGIKAEYLQDISDEDCLKEGIIKSDKGYGFCRNGAYEFYDTPVNAFSVLINSLPGPKVWRKNPIVWVYEFELID